MVISFCGHRDFIKTEKVVEQLFLILEEVVGENSVLFYLGGYGGFDNFAYECCKKYKSAHANVKLVFVTPYLTESYQKNRLQGIKDNFDDIIYPELEKRLPRLAVLFRNYYMVEAADYVVAYVNRDWGGAYKTLEYAKKLGKKIINLAEL